MIISIENNLRNNASSISTNDLIYYLQYNTNNSQLNPNNLTETQNYLSKIVNSFCYENIFINTSNYSSITTSIIGLLIPFYFLYPRFYKLGFITLLIGVISFINLYVKLNTLYSHFFSKAGILFFMFTFLIYVIFFVLFNKLNHITLFFISAIISFLAINYILRVTLTIPLKSNIYNQYKATSNNNTNFTEYNELLEICCYQVIQRFNLNQLPSGVMLYSYLTQFEIGTNSNMYSDFITYSFGPIVSFILLWILGSFLSIVENKSENGEGINLFPIIGINNESFDYYTCQANYVLPLQFNVDLLIFQLIEKYKFNDKIYAQFQKALLRISHDLLKKYNPKFKLDYETNQEIFNNLKNNKIYKKIEELLKNTNIKLDLKYIDEIRKKIIDSEFNSEKIEMLELLKNINNTLVITNNINKNYENDSELALNELLYNKEIDEEYKPRLKEIVSKYIEKFKENLNLKDGILFGYDYNIITYDLFNNKTRLYSNKIFAYLLRFISTWIVFAKPIGSPWLITQYILTSGKNFNHLLKNLRGEFWIWKYFTLGLDSSYFEDKYTNINDKESLIEEGLGVLYSIIIFIILLPIMYFYNSTVFGLLSSPSWYNILYQVVFIINILGNLNCYITGGSNLFFNIKFIIAYILIVIFSSIIIYFFSKYLLPKI